MVFRQWKIIEPKGERYSGKFSLLQLLPEWRDEKRLEGLVEYISSFRRVPLSFSACARRRALLPDFPAIAKL